MLAFKEQLFTALCLCSIGTQLVSSHSIIGTGRDSSRDGACPQLMFQSLSRGLLAYPAAAGEDYPRNADCEWTIEVSGAERIDLYFLSFDIEFSRGCIYDYLSIDLPLGLKLCGQKLPEPISVSGDRVRLAFHSDNVGQNRGFRLAFRAAFRNAGSDVHSTDPPTQTSTPSAAPATQPQASVACGVSPLDSLRENSLLTEDEKIIGGIPSQANQWPWMVSLRYRDSERCGATLITNRHVLTAAHCLKDFPDINGWSANLASYDTQVTNEPGELLIPLKLGHSHPGYELASRYDLDIAVAELSQPVPFSQRISHICLSEIPPLDAELCTVTGWGVTRQPPYTLLKEVSVPIVSTDRCNNSAKFPENFGRMTQNMFCAGFASGEKDACMGDSGGPLMCRRGQAWFQFGVVSWGPGGQCGAENVLGVYARTDGDVKRWIESVVGQPL